MKDLIKKLKKIKGKNVLVISHESPDGDAIGSIIGFSYLLKSLGANVLTINKDGVPVKYLFLEKDIKVRTLDGLSDIEKNREYVVFILDSANLERIGFNLDEVFSNISEVYNIDHHISNKFFADNNYVYPDKAATCEIVGSLYLDIEGFVPADAATAIYVGVMTDTGNLTYEATSTATVALISILMEMGADYNKARREIYEKSSVGQIEGLKGVLNNLKVSEDGLVAYTYLPFSIIEKYNLTSGDIEDFVDYPRRVDTSEIAILFKEFKDEIRVSVRTKSYIDGNRLASVFKGGGHPRAAGFKVKGNLEDSIEFVLNRIKEGLLKNEWSN